MGAVKRIEQIAGEIRIKSPAGPGTRGADIVSFNTLTGKVTLWDAKFRSAGRVPGSRQTRLLTRKSSQTRLGKRSTRSTQAR